MSENNKAPKLLRPYEDWSTDQLLLEEQVLFDAQADGINTWFEHELLLGELLKHRNIKLKVAT